MNYLADLIRGLWKENPVLVLTLGMCPTLATTSNAVNALGMGVATTFVLVCSNVAISLIKEFVPNKIRIPVYIVVIATFVTVVDMLMQAYAPPALYASLGIFIQLIVVNCIVLGRAEAFASKQSAGRSAMDGLGMGLGFTLALTVLGGVREFLSSGSLFAVKIVTPWTVDFALPSSNPGAFIILGLFLAGMNEWNRRRTLKNGGVYLPPQGLDCRHCALCLPSSEKKE